MLDILLINVPIESGKKPYDISTNLSKSINFGLLAIASYLSDKGFSTSVFDIRSTVYNPLEELLQTISDNSPTIVGLSCISGFSYAFCKQLANHIKKRFPRIIIIVGGKDHVGIIPRQVLTECKGIDIVVKGEGEETARKILTKIISRKSLHSIPNIMFRDSNGQIHETPESEDRFLNYIPRLDYNLYANFINYSASIEVSRGCPYNCAFCVSSRTNIQKKDISNIFKEATLLCKLHGRSNLNIYFETPNFLFGAKDLVCLAQLREENNLRFNWRTETRVEYLSQNNIALLQRAGAKVLDVGLESASPEILLRMRKTNAPDYYIKLASKALKNAYKNEITLKINILFYIGENKKTLRETYMFLSSHSEYISSISAYPMLKFPGMENFNNFEKELLKHGGSIIEKSPWSERRIYPINLSSELTYSEAEDYGILFGKAFQTMESFFYHKQYGYFPPNTEYSDFEAQVKSIGIERFPFSSNENEKIEFKNKLEQKLQISSGMRA